MKNYFFVKAEFRAPGSGWRATIGCRPVLALSDCGPFFSSFFYIFLVFFGKFGKWARPFRIMGV
jgi:hypothetical protein